MRTLREIAHDVRNAGQVAAADGIGIWAAELERLQERAGINPKERQEPHPPDGHVATPTPVPMGSSTVPAQSAPIHPHGSGHSAPPADVVASESKAGEDEGSKRAHAKR